MRTTNMLAVMLCSFVLLCGCAVTPKTAVGRSLQAVKASALSAMNAEADAYLIGQVSDADHKKVQDYYDEKFVPAFQLAVDTAHNDYSQLTPGNVSKLADQLASLIQQVTKGK